MTPQAELKVSKGPGKGCAVAGLALQLPGPEAMPTPGPQRPVVLGSCPIMGQGGQGGQGLVTAATRVAPSLL